MNIEQKIVGIVGLGYVGLPLAVAFGKKYKTVGFDLSETKIENYKKFYDAMGEVSSEELKAATHLTVSTDSATLSEADVIIIAVPTPVDEAHVPDFSPLIGSSTIVGRYMKKGATVVYESTVYPGATEDICIPILEKESGLRWKEDFFVGYSPERVNPGDKERTITKITKVVSGDTPETLEMVAALYGSVITAGVYPAASIKVAEAAKVIENTQRDINIALMNELAMIFDAIGIDTLEVLEAAGTKWNFLPFRPGLVGGHCIGVDPYYLTHKAQMVGQYPKIILAGRQINDGVASYVVSQTVKQMVRKGDKIKDSKVIVLGLTFKENCPDLRNSKVADVIKELKDFGCKVFVHDPLADAKDAKSEYGVDLFDWDDLPKDADTIFAAVSHKFYLEKPLQDILSRMKKDGLFVDLKSSYDQKAIQDSGAAVWRL